MLHSGFEPPGYALLLSGDLLLSGERRIEYSENMGVSSRLRRGSGALAFIGLLASVRCAAVSGLDNLDKVDCVERCDSSAKESGTIPEDASPDAIPSDAPSDSIAVVDESEMVDSSVDSAVDSSQVGESGDDGNPGSGDGQGDGPVDANSSDAPSDAPDATADATAMDGGPPPDSAPPDGAPTDAGTPQDAAHGDSSAPPDAAAEAGVVTTDHTATKDAYVRDGTFATMNFGMDVGLPAKIPPDGLAGYSRRGWVTFDVGQFTSITAAKLRLFLTSIDMPDMNDVLVNVYSTPAASNGWGELTLTWNNQPAIGPLIASNRVNTPNVGMWVEWDVTSTVQAEVGGMATFVIEGGGLGSLRLPVFSSREGMNPPVLRITGD